jgi:hypothetical protein
MILRASGSDILGKVGALAAGEGVARAVDDPDFAERPRELADQFDLDAGHRIISTQ